MLRKIARLTEDLGVNLAGVEVVLNMTRRIQELQRQLEQQHRQFAAEAAVLRQRIRELEDQLAEGVEPTIVQGDPRTQRRAGIDER
mgnify:FL=1